MKRLFDIVVSFLGLLVIGPYLIFLACLIKFHDHGSIFYKGERTGLYGKPFCIFKFRTMFEDAEKTGVSSTSDNDERITRIGKWLRKYKIDELPQLINVLKGEMSFVGPRPEVKKYTELYTIKEKAILSVRPGITDWASIWNPDEGAVLAGFKDPDKAYEEIIRPAKLRLQLKYVKESNFWIDLIILFLTFCSLCGLKNKILKEIQRF